MNFRKVNNITGWLVFLVASLVYILTHEATASLWDTGEFIASADKLQLPHPPGAPTFVLLGRLFIILFGAGNPAGAVNLMSALASSFTILFLFWTITHFARKMFVSTDGDFSTQQMVTIMGAGVVGAFAYTFSDSFWYSAVEGEVYALSSFFTALVFWSMLKWERASDRAGDNLAEQQRADRWIVFIFFMMGLSIGVHLLNLLTIPAIVVIYYFKRYRPTTKGSIIAFIIGCIIVGLVQVLVIKYSVKIAGRFDILFVNSFGLPFFSGFIFFFILLGILCWWGLKKASRKGWAYLHLGLWCFIFMMVGYSTYSTTLVRSNANPVIDMNNVDNPMSLVYYLGREQYGSAPLVYGPHFMADVDYDETGSPYKPGEMEYVKGDDKYIPIGRKNEVRYASEDMQLFPRVWDPSNDQGHAQFYADWLNLERFSDPQTGQPRYEDPTYGDNFQWFFTYQLGFMYWRYFMWNFSGKQNDIQGFGNKRDGNWITGIPVIDKQVLGDQEKLPDSIRNNKAHNELYLIPFLLGILGCVFQFIRNKKDWIVTFLLFFFTGIAIVLYLNQPGSQPRERDYAYVGSFYAFAIWIGLAVPALVRLAREKEDKKTFTNSLLYGSVLTLLIAGMSYVYGSGGMVPTLMITALFALLAGGATLLVRALSSAGRNWNIANIVAIAFCMLAPALMANREWNDHDRSRKTIAVDLAVNYLESCAPNAIIFTFGDNDTYPLWYAQEVEGVRPDIRIINNSLLGIDWYANQLRYKVNESAPVDVIWSKEQIMGHNREYMRFNPNSGVSQTTWFPLYDAMKNVLGRDEIDPETGMDRGPLYFPAKRFSVPVNKEVVTNNGTVTKNDTVLSEIHIEIPQNKNILLRNELMILNIIAANNWKRPIYFTHPYGELGFGQYLRKEGLAYRLTPAQNSYPQGNWIVDQTMRKLQFGGTAIRDNEFDAMYETIMTQFRSGGADLEGMYFDEENRRHLLSIRATMAELAGNLADIGRKDSANNVLKRSEEMMLPSNLPYAMVSRYNMHNQTGLIYLEAAYKAGNTELATKLNQAVRHDLEQQKQYYDYMAGKGQGMISSLQLEKEINDALMFVLQQLENKYNPAAAQPPAEGQQAPIINE